MIAIARIKPLFANPAPGALKRALLAGFAWGFGLAAGLTALRAAQCGMVCLDEAATTATISIAAGLVTMGPIAAFGRR